MADLFEHYDSATAYNCSPITRSTEFTKLMYLVSQKHRIEVIRDYLINNRNEINRTNRCGWTALMIAARNSNTENEVEVVRLLLTNGAEVNRVTDNGWSALMLAARYAKTESNIAAVKLLIVHGANVNYFNKNDWSILQLVAGNIGRDISIETFRLLVENGADVNYISNGQSVLTIITGITCKCGNFEALESLINYGTKFQALTNSNKCLELIIHYQHHRLCLKKILPCMKTRATHVMYAPNSLRARLLNIKWKVTNNGLSTTYEWVKTNDSKILEYLSIDNEDMFEFKMTDIFHNIN